jgi:predicted MPP superfamily phosphohydrolase
LDVLYFADLFKPMRRKAFLIIIIIVACILLSDFVVYKQILGYIASFDNITLINLIKYLYWIILPLLILCMLIFQRYFYNPQKSAFSGIMFVFVGLFFLIYIPKILFTILLLFQKMIFWLYYHNSDLFLKKCPFDLISRIALYGSGMAFMIILYGITLGRFRFRIRRINLFFNNLPDAFNGLKAIQISDLHAGSLLRNHRKYMKAVSMIHKEKPDIIFFTGDIVNEFAGELDGWENVIGQLDAKYGKFSVLGNHDYGDYYRWKKEEEKKDNLRNIINREIKMGFRVLLNESVSISKNGQKINILGVENWGLLHFKQYGNLEKALTGLENSVFKILLTHDPSHWEAEVTGKTNIDLTLSGHTHGFQFGIRTRRFRWSPVKWIYPRWEGLHRIGDQILYINTGLGYIGFPGRIGMPPEITVISLSKSK